MEHRSLPNRTWLLLGFLGFLLIAFVQGDSINLTSGNVYYAQLQGTFGTVNWGGLIVTNSNTSLSESLSPFASLTLASPVIASVAFPGANLMDGKHYYATMVVGGTMNLSQLRNVSLTDLESGQLFGSGNFSTFYPGYYSKSDNPNKTFCCTLTNLTISNTNFTAFTVTLQHNVTYYVVKYGLGSGTPLFVVPFQDFTCYNSTACVSQFILPISNTAYNFYMLTSDPVYGLTTWIDGVQTTVFNQTALPYNLTVEVRNAVTGLTEENRSILVGEDNGQNIFIPYRLSGTVTQSFAVGRSDAEGKEYFLVAPTAYGDIGNYSIYVGVLLDGLVTNQQVLSITTTSTVVQQAKHAVPNVLNDDAKVSVNAMKQLVSTLFTWASTLQQAKKVSVSYELSNGTFTFNHTPTRANNSRLFLKTGAPNVINLTIRNGGVAQTGYRGKIEERGGFLIIHPHTGNDSLSLKTRIENQVVPVATEFIVTPTSLGLIASNVTLHILNGSGSILNSTFAIINTTLEVDSGTTYSNDLLKTIVNNMNILLSSLFYSFNT